MCNAFNHPPGCRCGWGGDGHVGRSPGGLSSRSPNAQGRQAPHRPNWDKLAFRGFVNPNASCPVCGTRVFYYESPDGGRVFFDELGPPWPKHPCTDITRIRRGSRDLGARGKPTPSRRIRDHGGSEVHIPLDFVSNAEGWHLFHCTEYQRLDTWTVLTGRLSGTAKDVVVYVETETDLHDRLLLARVGGNASGRIAFSSVSLADGVLSPLEWEGLFAEAWLKRHWSQIAGAPAILHWFLLAENLPKSAFTLEYRNRRGTRPFISNPHDWYQELMEKVARGPRKLTQHTAEELLGRLLALRRQVDR